MNRRPTRWIGHRAVQAVLVVLILAGAVNLVSSLVEHTEVLEVITALGQVALFGFTLSQSVQSRRYHAQQD